MITRIYRWFSSKYIFKEGYPKHLKSSGYISILNNNLKLIIDCAEVGPRYLPGHGHADTLSFELFAGSNKLFINSGCSEYGNGSRRLFERSTKAHNTVNVNNINSSDVWSGFRVGKRAKPKLLDFSYSNNEVYIKASHSGYSKPLKDCTHIRSWLIKKNFLEIKDIVSGSFNNATAIFILYPYLECKLENNKHAKVYQESKLLADIKIKGGNMRINTCKVSMYFGQLIESKKLEISILNQRETTASIEIFEID